MSHAAQQNERRITAAAGAPGKPGSVLERHRIWAAWLRSLAREASLTPQEYRVMRYTLIDRYSVRAISQRRRVIKTEVARWKKRALAKLLQVPGYFDAAQAFARDVVECADNRGMYEDRPPELRGVTPAEDGRHLRRARMVPPDDLRLRQDAESAGRLLLLKETVARGS